MSKQTAVNESIIKNLLPTPYNVEIIPDNFYISDATIIRVCHNKSEKALFAAKRLSHMVQTEFGLNVPVIEKYSTVKCQVQIFDKSNKLNCNTETPHDFEPLGDEGYFLSTNNQGITIHANYPEGIFYGIGTLFQLIHIHEGNVKVPGVRIKDKPRYKWRGFQIDSGRSPNSLAKTKRIIRICSAFKLNFLTFREGDDELNAVRYKTNKLGSENPHAIKITEMKDLIDYAFKYGITIMPEIESLGHSSAKGFHYPELIDGGFEEYYEGIGTHKRKAHLNPSDPRSYELLDSIYSEWIPIIKSPFIHIGLDEVQLDMESQTLHLEKLLSLLDRLSKKFNKNLIPIVWGDGPPTPVNYKNRVVRCLWSYADESEVGPENGHLINQSIHSMFNKNNEENFLLAGGSASTHQPYGKSSDKDAFENLASWSKWAKDNPNALGILAVQWSGNMLDNWLKDFIAAAEFGWNSSTDTLGFKSWEKRVDFQLNKITDVTKPKAGEIDRPAWDGIWLAGNNWYEDIMTGKRNEKFINVSTRAPDGDTICSDMPC